MSGGVELIGVIASAAQLSSYVVRIAAQIQAVRAELREAPERIRQQDSHLLYLLSIIDSLRHSCIPCTKDIQPHLQRIQDNINNLRGVLEKNLKYLKKESIKKFWRALHTIKAEERILSVFRSLEADKSNLILYLLGSCGETLQGIHRISKQQMEQWAKVGENFKKELTNMSDKPSVPSVLSDSNKTMRDESLNSSGKSNPAQSDRRVTTSGSIQSQSEAQQASRSTVKNVLRNNPVVGVCTTSRLGVTFLPTGGNNVDVDNEIDSSGAYGNFLRVEHAVTGEDRGRRSSTPVQHGVTEESKDP